MNRIQIGMSVGSSVCPTDVGRYKNEGDDANMKNLQELPKLKDSISYLYIEHAIIEQNDTAIVAIKKEGKIPIPIAAMTCLLLGPGTRVTHAAIVSLGYSAGLGFIHTGKQLSFVYDVADLYKAETTIPVAFEAVRAAQQGRDLHKEIRMRCRTHFANAKVLSRIAQDIAWVLQTGESEEQNNGTQVGDLWDDEAGVTSGGQNYGERGEEP